MNVLGIHGGPRGAKSQTLRLVKAALTGAKSRMCHVELVDLCKLDIRCCTACGACYRRGTCPKKDDFHKLYAKILAADGLVVGSPNYFHSVTAQMKTMIDRMADAVHCQLLRGKYAAVVATSGAAGQDRQVTKYLTDIMQGFGCFIVGAAGAAVASGGAAMAEAEREAFRLGEKLANDIDKRREYRKQRRLIDENRQFFQNLVKLHKDEWLHEYAYWDRLNWT